MTDKMRGSRALSHVLAIVLMVAAVSAPAAQAQTFTVLHDFTNAPDGATPNSAPILDAAGNLYGTTEGGGDSSCLGCGTIFEIDKNGNETVLYRFTGGSDGALPLARPIRDAAGNFYGTTEGNGFTASPSTVYKLDKSGQLTVLYTFTGRDDGCCADSPLVSDSEGNLYGTTPYAGAGNCNNDLGCGVVFRVDTSGRFSVVHTFTGPDGQYPQGGLVIDAGNLYGSTWWGGDLNCLPPTGCGTVFKLDAGGKFTVLYRFKGGADGRTPLGLIQDSVGNLYGIASGDGDLKCDPPFGGCGTIFRVDTNGKFSVLYTFTQKDYPLHNAGFFVPHLVRDTKGNLYGANQLDGAHNSGYLFELSSKGKFTNLFNFPEAAPTQNGFYPVGFVLNPGRGIYGAMQLGGDPNNSGDTCCGTLFEITP